MEEPLANTAARLRHEIDSGKTGDKVDFPDPAAAPLGTDDEASGHPITPTQASMARHAEVRPLSAPVGRPGAAYAIPVVLGLILTAGFAWLLVR